MSAYDTLSSSLSQGNAMNSTVLIVDDSRTLRRVVRRSLTMAGVPDDDIDEANDGLEALRKIRASPPCVVISDVNMPGMSGIELLQALRAEPETAKLPVVIITSVSSSRALLEVVRLGASKVIRKPFDPLSLPDALSAFLPEPSDLTEPVDGVVSEEPVEPAERVEPVWDDRAVACVASVMESMVFSMAVPVDDPPPEDRLLVGAEIRVQSGSIGSLHVSTTLATARELASRLVGESVAEDDEIACFDCVGELANVLVGAMLGADGDDDSQEDEATFTVPRRVTVAPGSELTVKPRAFSLDGGEHRVYVGVAA